MSAHHPDGRLIVRLRRGDAEALSALYKQYCTQVYRTALAITHDESAAEDILQECFIRLFIHAGRIDPARPLGSWLYRVTVNLSYSWANRYRRWLGPLEEVVGRLVVPAAQWPEQLAEQQELEGAVQQAIRTLPLAQWVVVVLYYLEGLSVEEIADVVGVPEGTVKSRLHYARRRLRQVLERRHRWVPEVAYDFT